MPTRIAIESKDVEYGGINSGFQHLYLVKTVTDSQGRVLSEKVIRGSNLNDGSLGTVVNVDLAASPDRRGGETALQRHNTPLNLDGRNADDVWKVMVEHARNIDKANLDYSFDIYRQAPGYDLNSNSVVASVLHSVGLEQRLPTGISRSEAPLYGQLQYMSVNDVLSGTANADRMYGGVGNDRLYGVSGNDRVYGEAGNDRLYGNLGNDYVRGGAGNDRIYGGSGNDSLYGDANADAFVFNTTPNGATNIDSIRDFSARDDRVWLDNSVFTAVGRNGDLTPGAFWRGSEAHDTSDRVIYDRSTGILYYDQDGTGATEQVAFAKLTTKPTFTYADILIV
jgi:RTX calcium-binding nonapeptide repeat (4 copies)